MKTVQTYVAWIAGKLQRLAALFDPEVLQWPGGTVFALFLLCLGPVSLALDRTIYH